MYAGFTSITGEAKLTCTKQDTCLAYTGETPIELLSVLSESLDNLYAELVHLEKAADEYIAQKILSKEQE